MATGVFGGTFDPVHIGHLRTALELSEHLHLDKMLLIPCGDPPHRAAPLTPGPQRLEMVELAIAGEPSLMADSREITRAGPSYTIDTLVELRRELGPEEPLYLCIGMDSLGQLNTWRQWRDYLDYAHLVIAARPGWTLPVTGELAQWIDEQHRASALDLTTAPCGMLYTVEMTLLPVAATDLRLALVAGKSIRYLTPDSVVDYIRHHGLYRQAT